jgi:hypothetical protein
MARKRAKRLSNEAVLATVKKEMAEPRVAVSARMGAKRRGVAKIRKAA